jgi:hypothetical protein
LFRKLVLLGSTAALLAGSLMVGGVAHAGATQDVSHYTVSCDTMQKGTVGFKPSLLLGGTTPEVVSIKGTLNGCTATPDGSNPAVTVVSGSVKGSLTGGTNDCLSLLGPSTATGTLTITWKTVPAITQKSTVVTISGGNVSGGTANPFSDSATYGEFNISGAAVSGAFLGADNGASSVTHSLTAEGVGFLGANCTPPAKGLKAVTLGSTETNFG